MPVCSQTMLIVSRGGLKARIAEHSELAFRACDNYQHPASLDQGLLDRVTHMENIGGVIYRELYLALYGLGGVYDGNEERRHLGNLIASPTLLLVGGLGAGQLAPLFSYSLHDCLPYSGTYLTWGSREETGRVSPFQRK